MQNNALAPEFQYIRKYIQKLADKGALGLTDDAMVENVHFFANDPVDLIAQKLLRCNLLDLAGMGAEPVGYLFNSIFA